MQSVIDLVLIRLLLRLQLPAGERLLHRPTANSAVSGGWAAGAGPRASSGAKEPAAGGAVDVLWSHIGVDRFQAVWQRPRGDFCGRWRRRGGDGVPPGGEGSAARMRGGRGRGVGTRARPRWDGGGARAPSRSITPESRRWLSAEVVV